MIDQSENSDDRSIERALSLLPGVDQVSFFSRDRIVYLRVNEEEFDRGALRDIEGLVDSAD
ncbi:MAG: hypothetical protein EBY36_10110 [Gammaproteobacteria bacterium]|nr:hypothetical protein [Gammaproteobacteria bacterium]